MRRECVHARMCVCVCKKGNGNLKERGMEVEARQFAFGGVSQIKDKG